MTSAQMGIGGAQAELPPRGSRSRALQALFAPRSIAIVGLSARRGVAQFVLGNLEAYGYGGAVIGVNPNYHHVAGYQCVPSVDSLPFAVDCIVVAIGGPAAVRAIRDAADLGVPAAILLAAGFAEAGEDGTALQAEVVSAAAEHGMAVLGPNCIGLINVADKVAPFGAQLDARLQPGGVAAVVQSGSVAIALSHPARRLGFSYIASIGNEAVVDAAQCIDFALADPRVTTIAAFLEGIRHPAAFIDALGRAREARVPVVALKAGRSPAGRRSSLAHTASLVGSDLAFDAVCRQHGVTRVRDLDELVEVTKLLSSGQIPQGDGLAVMTLSGGESTLMLDRAHDLGLRLPDLARSTCERLSAVLPHFAVAANPLDGTGVAANDPELFGACISALAADPGVDLLLVLDDAIEGAAYAPPVARAVAGLLPTLDTPLVWCGTFSRGIDDEVEKVLDDAGVPFLYGMEEGLRAVAALLAYRRFLSRRQPGPTTSGRRAPTGRLDTLSAGGNRLVGPQAAPLCRAYHIPYIQHAVVTSREEAAARMQDLQVPLALKLADATLAHKTEVGGVRLGLTDEEELLEAFDALARVAREHGLAQRFELQQMQSGVELIVGATRDDFGALVTVGLGGIFAELLRDVSIRVAPLTPADAEEMLSELRGAAILEGYRGHEPVRKSALIELILRVSDLAIDLGMRLEDLDLNPVIVSGDGVVVVDALVTLREDKPAHDV